MHKISALLATPIITAALLASSMQTANAAAIGVTPSGGISRHEHSYNLAIPNQIVKPRVAMSGALKASNLPDSVDLTQYATTPGDQGQEGSCVSWGIVHTMLGWYANKAGSPENFAPMYIYSQTHLDNTADGGGSYAQDAYDITYTQGVDTSAHYTHGDHNFIVKPTVAETANAAQYKTTPFNELFIAPDGGAGTAGATVIKQALASGQPVGLGIPIYGGFENLNPVDYTWHQADNGGSANYEGGHYLVALGYNSTGVVVENSWGTTWGNKGYAVLGWDFVKGSVNEAETLGGGFVKNLPATSYTAPTAPRNLTASALTTSKADLTWDAPLDNGNAKVNSYTLTLKHSGTTQSFNVNGKYIGERFTGLKPYSSYTFTLSATNAYGTSPVASKTFRTAGYTPKLHTVKHVAAKTSTKITWTAASARTGHITKYVITVKKAGKTVQTHTYKASTRKASIKHLKRHTTYRYTFTAYNSAGKHTSKSFNVKTK